MGLLTFILLLIVAGVASVVHSLIVGWVGLHAVGRFVAYALVLTLPVLLPRLIGG